ncbi:hypothetical protein HDU78_000986 [Chytriomyces hyalinus]|nr:hypothetical protein HDU78_000986 [Chytriomyces hyalinus]
MDEGSFFHVTWPGSRYLNVRPVQSPQPLARPSSFDAIEGTRPPAGSYFEVTVLENGGTLRELDADGNVLADDEEWMLAGRDFPDRDIGFLGIGLAMRPYSSFNHVGWDFGSFGFHSDDGKLFDGCLQGGFPWDGPYTLGDVVGVGLDANGDVFVTKNGSLCGPVVKGRVARIPASHYEWRLHPTVSAYCEEMLKLPTELQQRIGLEYLSATDYARMRGTCRSIRDTLTLPLACGFVLGTDWLSDNAACIDIPAQHGGTRVVYDASKASAAAGSFSHFELISDGHFAMTVPQPETPPWAIPDDFAPTQEQEASVPVTRDTRLCPRLRFTRFAHTRIPITAAATFMPYGSLHTPYVEFSILSPTDGDDSSYIDLSIGLVSKTFLYKHNYSLSNDPLSVAYESQHGMINLGTRNGEGFQFAVPYTLGDVVGVGMILDTTSKILKSETAPPPTHLLHPQRVQQPCVFFTLNGEWVGDAPFRISSDLTDFSQSLFPAVGFHASSAPIEVEINMGSAPFMFDVSLDRMRATLGDLKRPHQIAAPGEDTQLLPRISKITRISMEKPMLDRIVKSATMPAHFLELRFLDSSTDSEAVKLNGPSVFTLESCPLPESVCSEPEIPPNVEKQSGSGSFHVTWMGARYVNVRNVQSPHPLTIPLSSDEYAGARPPVGSYFEVTVLENSSTLGEQGNGNEEIEDEWFVPGAVPEPDLGFLGIGLAMRPYSCFYHVGWDFGSFGFHSDDGKLFDGSGQGGFPWDGPFTVGDVVGVGLDSAGDIFMTKNGSLCGPVVKGRIARIPASHFEWRLHPTFSACMKWKISVNFGSAEFLFNWPEENSF